MLNCICSSCKNLKSIISNDGEGVDTQCEFGYPSQDCCNCESDDCEITCSHYIEDKDEASSRKVCCSSCGAELEKAFDDGDDDSDIFCMECYLNNL